MTAYTAVKLGGYTLAGAVLNRRAAASRPLPIAFGATRTIVGVAAGTGSVLLASRLDVDRADLYFLIGLAPVRIGEWLFVLWLFYRGTVLWRAQRLRVACVGTMWSFVLDVPALLAVITVPGGMWIC